MKVWHTSHMRDYRKACKLTRWLYHMKPFNFLCHYDLLLRCSCWTSYLSSMCYPCICISQNQLYPRLGNESTDSSQKCISMAAAFELLPIIRMLLRSPYEDYQMIGVDAISTMVARWKPQLVRISKVGYWAACHRCDMHVGMHRWMWHACWDA